MKLMFIFMFVTLCLSIPCIYIYPTIIPKHNQHKLSFSNLTTQWSSIMYTVTNSYNGYSISYQYKDNIIIDYQDPFTISVNLYSFTIVPLDSIMYPCVIYDSPMMTLTYNNVSTNYNPIIVYSEANQKNIILSMLIWIIAFVIVSNICNIFTFSICFCVIARKLIAYVKL